MKKNANCDYLEIVDKWELVNGIANAFISQIKNLRKVTWVDVDNAIDDVYSYNIVSAVKKVITAYCELTDTPFPYDDSGFPDDN